MSKIYWREGWGLCYVNGFQHHAFPWLPDPCESIPAEAERYARGEERLRDIAKRRCVAVLTVRKVFQHYGIRFSHGGAAPTVQRRVQERERRILAALDEEPIANNRVLSRMLDEPYHIINESIKRLRRKGMVD